MKNTSHKETSKYSLLDHKSIRNNTKSFAGKRRIHLKKCNNKNRDYTARTVEDMADFEYIIASAVFHVILFQDL